MLMLSGEDKRLVDLVSDVLVDPNLHTDTRMRLGSEIAQLAHATREQQHSASPPPGPDRRPAEHPSDPTGLLEAVLVDPNLPTDLRMRLHEQITEMLSDDSPERASLPDHHA